ncbi:lipid-A-disaccharide synthase [Neomegalonema sp.]|uniref:lipid-A-disaccharide synthase n=1 Tax=Neomegalonema sp. TaxID=2039713 RepID=UPI002621789E|nr:lipid-A-disaccharide synthase [Neomegalonema sp.]MDD2869169.1 lipid-A-disaccharide synthase [Neomegalonema sp.]
MSEGGIFLLAGEASGDRLGAALMRRLREIAPERPLYGVGGEAMEAEGLRSLFPMQDLAVMGFAEVIPSLPRILRRLKQATAEIARLKPAALVTIDAQGFSKRLQTRAREVSPQTARVHYVAPTVWAWKPGRAQKLAGLIDHLMALFPFEPPYFTVHGLSCDFVGHPAAERVGEADPRAAEALARDLGLSPEAPVLVALPGSRRGEIARLAEPFGAALGLLKGRHPDLQALLPMAEGSAALAVEAAARWPVRPHLLDPRGQPFAQSEARKFAAFRLTARDETRRGGAALAASGSVTLELAACGAPMVVGYKAHPLSAAIARRLLKIDTATLPNLLSGEKAIPEYFQEDCTPEALAAALEPLLRSGPGRARQERAAARALAALGGGPGEELPSLRAARSLLAAIRRKEAAAIVS